MENPEVKQFGRYEVVGELGRGAMGVVYQARDPQIDRMVAVKTVSLRRQEPDEEKEFRMRFMNEAQAAGRLHHSGIVGVFDVGENPENQDPYIVLEYVAGESLNRILSREKKLPVAQALQIAIEIADALEYAHAQGVVHRDIKPGNILVTPDGHAKIADFGIAKLNLAHFTVPGRVLGTPAYMAPEQLSGEGADGRSDLFSLGVILYVLVTGHSPFQGDSATTVCFKVANKEPMAASALDMTLPPELDTIIGRAMAKDPEERYQTGGEFASDLRFLQQRIAPAASSTSSQLKAATGTRSGLTGSSVSRRVSPGTAISDHVAVVEKAQKAARHFFAHAPIRDLILGAATVALFVIVGIQTRVLVSSSKAPISQASEGTGTPVAVMQDLGAPHEAAQPVKKTVAPHGATNKKNAAKIAPAASQVIVPSSTLDLSVQHQFKDATLYLWVDDKLILTRPLHGGAQKKLVVFSGIHGVDSESVKIPAGKHTLRFRALSTDQTFDLSKTVSADFVGGDTRSLQLTFDKHNSVRLDWQ